MENIDVNNIWLLLSKPDDIVTCYFPKNKNKHVLPQMFMFGLFFFTFNQRSIKTVIRRQTRDTPLRAHSLSVLPTVIFHLANPTTTVILPHNHSLPSDLHPTVQNHHTLLTKTLKKTHYVLIYIRSNSFLWVNFLGSVTVAKLIECERVRVRD